ncbi:hypothetical protein [Halorussus litoreus]|uniref:hypothetical protein n=1 Tax=Halorussus litoreus TaxID=1710536 RepID=UPI000E252809|nr:hypothetical protein [Halorussus litoreus]
MSGRAESERVADRSATPSEHPRLGGASALVAALALLVFPGESPVVAVLGAVAVPVAWYLLTPAYAFALGHVTLAAILPAGALAGGTNLVWIAAVEAGLVGMLLAPVLKRERPDESAGLGGEGADEVAETPEEGADEFGGRFDGGLDLGGAVVLLGWVAAGVGLAWASTRGSLALSTAGGLLLGASALVAFGLHRYQLVSLGVVGGDDE